MNVGQYRTLLGELELKKAELTQVHDNNAFGYAKIVLANAMTDIQSQLADLLSIELMPVPVVVSISSLASTLTKAVGDTAQLAITATFTDGSLRDVTKGFNTVATFRDSDTGYNNKGFITSVDTSGFVTVTAVKFRVVKTANGWHVDADSMLGLGVAATGNTNEYDIVDIDGDVIGVKFTTNGNELKGDNWNIDVEGKASGTAYVSSDTAVATVDGNGLITAVAVGTANITITNNGSTIVVPVTVA